jgi:hypothetical protein
MATIDTLQDAVNTLTSSTTSLLDEVSTSKTYLDAAKDSAEDARDTALTHKTGAETAKTGAEAARDLAYSYQQSAASAVAYQDLAAIAESKSDSAVDVFVYDTRKDSDGGAWRKRCQHTSWYNETLNTSTRGSRKEFPAVAVIVMEAYKLTIYDGDDPALPMWMVFENAGSLSWASNSTVLYNSVMAVNGIVVPVSVAGSVIYDFGKDDTRLVGVNAYELSSNKALVARNGATSWVSGGNGLAIVNSQVNDVAMTVLPNAPIDSATGLPVPTIAVATNGGVSVIKDDGTVVDMQVNQNGYKVSKVNFDDINRVCWSQGYSDVYPFRLYREDIPESDTTYSTVNSFDKYSAPYILGDNTNTSQLTTYIGNTACGGLLGVTSIDEDLTSKENSSVAYITSDYNTGWMNGDIKLATLSDTDDTDVTGAELVTNGTFDTDMTGWTSVGSSILSVSSGTGKFERGSTYGVGYQTLTLTAGKTYTVSADLRLDATASGSAVIGVSTNDSSLYSNAIYSGGTSSTSFVSKSFTFTATSSSYYVGLRAYINEGESVYVDNFSVRLAEEDRSVNGNGLQVFGSLVKDPVATGADLVGWGGFTSDSYLKQPYNSDLDFGTGDICMMAWVKTTDGYGVIMERKSPDNSDGRILMGTYPYGGVTGAFQANLNGYPIYSSKTIDDDKWHHVVAVRRYGNSFDLYIDGVLDTSNTTSFAKDADVTASDTNTYTLIGVRNDLQQNLSGKVALLRISATAPSAEQIAKIYEDEKVLFQENAKATLYGSSDAVTALAYDDDTELLHVGTSEGRSDFQGLRRVSNTTDAVGAAISASNGLIAED